MRSSKGTPTQQRKEVAEKPKAMTAGELAEHVKKSMITAYTNLANAPADFDCVVEFFVTLTALNDALKNAIVADRAQEERLNKTFYDAMHHQEVTVKKDAFFQSDIQSHISALEVESKNVEVNKGLVKLGRDVHSVRRQVCTVVFSDGDRSITCIQAELTNATVLADLKACFAAKLQALNPKDEEVAEAANRLGNM